MYASNDLHCTVDRRNKPLHRLGAAITPKPLTTINSAPVFWGRRVEEFIKSHLYIISDLSSLMKTSGHHSKIVPGAPLSSEGQGQRGKGRGRGRGGGVKEGRREGGGGIKVRVWGGPWGRGGV